MACSSPSTSLLLVVDIWLMRRYAQDGPGRAGRRGRSPRARHPRWATEWISRCSGSAWSASSVAAYFLLEGVRLRRRDAAAVPARATRRSAARCSARSGPSGTATRVARGGRRHDVRGVPGLVRDDVLGVLHRAAAAALLPDRPRDLVRVARASTRTRAGSGSGPGPTPSGATAPALIWGVASREPALRRAARLERRLRRRLSGISSASYTVLGGVTVVAAVRVSRRDVPDAAGDRRAFLDRAGRTARALSYRRRCARRRIPGDDRRRRDGPQRPGPLPPRPAGGCSGSPRSARGASAFSTRSGWAFGMTALGTVLAVVTLFTSLYPRVMVSDPDFGNSLTVDGASSAHYTLAVMSVVALLAVPVILLYQAWTYRVFRHRLGEPTSPRRGLRRRCARSPRSSRASAGPPPRGPRRAGPSPARVDIGLGVATALVVIVQATLLARVVAQAFDGASLGAMSDRRSCCSGSRSPPAGRSRGLRGRGRPRRRDGPLGVPARARRAAAPTQPAALDGVEAGGDRRGRRPGSRRPRAVSAATSPRSCSRASSRSRCSAGSRRSTSRRRSSCSRRCRSCRSSCGSSGATPRSGRASAGSRSGASRRTSSTSSAACRPCGC